MFDDLIRKKKLKKLKVKWTVELTEELKTIHGIVIKEKKKYKGEMKENV